MASVSTSVNLNEYSTLFNSMQIDLSKTAEIAKAVNLINVGKNRYVAVATCNLRMPWYAIGIAHYMEGNCNFTKHIHNGDSLNARTVQVPAGRPIAPPKFGSRYTWEESCLDWIRLKRWDKWQDWGVSDILYRLEANNGMGYRNRGEATPYLWSYTNHYEKGKFVADGKYDEDAVSKQVGAAILLKELM